MRCDTVLPRGADAPLRLAALILLLTPTHANIYTYSDASLQPDVVEYRRVGMWAPADIPHQRGGAIADSSVSIDLTFKRSNPQRAGLIQVALFNAEQMPRVGTMPAGGATRRVFCCTAAVAASRKVPGCDVAGKLIIAPPPMSSDGGAAAHHRNHHHEVTVHDVSFGTNVSEAHLSQRILIKQSGVHYLLVSSCEPRTGGVRFSGRTEWKNPHGYLPGELYPFLPFYGVLTLTYLLLLLGWVALCYKHRTQLLPLQSAIGGVLLLALLEAAVWWRCYHAFNEGGHRGVAPTILGVLVSTVRKTISRGLVLTVCLGFGVMRPTIGPIWPRILLLGALYFVASAALDVISNTSRLEDLTAPTRLLIVLPVGVLDALYFWWCCTAISRTLSQLAARRQSAKLLLYRRFSHVLLALMLLSGLWIGWQMLTIMTDAIDSNWAQLWTFDAFWHVLYLGVLVTICVLWSPSKNNLQYAYMDELANLDEESLNDPDEDGGGSAEAVVTPYDLKRGA